MLYLLDGDAHFHSVTGLIQIVGTGVNGTFVVPEMIVVAIANTDRTRDMTPTHVETGRDGVVRAYNQSGLRYGFRYYPDDSHGSVPLIAEYDALRFIFSGYDPNMLRVLERPTLLREHFARVSRELGQDRPPPEAVVELLAQVAMQQDRTRSLAFRALNTELYPSSARAHDALAGAYLAQGDTVRAIASMRTTLSLAPSRRWAKETLARLTGNR